MLITKKKTHLIIDINGKWLFLMTYRVRVNVWSGDISCVNCVRDINIGLPKTTFGSMSPICSEKRLPELANYSGYEVQC